MSVFKKYRFRFEKLCFKLHFIAHIIKYISFLLVTKLYILQILRDKMYAKFTKAELNIAKVLSYYICLYYKHVYLTTYEKLPATYLLFCYSSFLKHRQYRSLSCSTTSKVLLPLQHIQKEAFPLCV